MTRYSIFDKSYSDRVKSFILDMMSILGCQVIISHLFENSARISLKWYLP